MLTLCLSSVFLKIFFLHSIGVEVLRIHITYENINITGFFNTCARMSRRLLYTCFMKAVMCSWVTLTYPFIIYSTFKHLSLFYFASIHSILKNIMI